MPSLADIKDKLEPMDLGFEEKEHETPPVTLEGDYGQYVDMDAPIPDIKDLGTINPPVGLDMNKVGNAMFSAHSLGMPANEAYHADKEIEDKKKQYEHKDLLKSWQASFKSSNKNMQVHELYYKLFAGQGTPDTWAKINQLEGEIEELRPDILDDNLFEKALMSTANLLPSALRSMVKGTKTGMVTAMGMGSAALLTAPPLAPEMYLAGFTAGTTAGGAKYIAEVEMGGTYKYLRGLKDDDGKPINPAFVDAAVGAVGMINGALEAVQFKLLLKTIPGIDKAVSASMQKAIKDFLVDGSMAKYLIGNAKRYAGFVAGETAVEVAQEISSITHQQLAIAADNVLIGSDIPHEKWPAIKDQLFSTIFSSAAGFGILGVPGHAVQTAKGIIESKSQVEHDEFKRLLADEPDPNAAKEIKGTWDRIKDIFFGNRDVRLYENRNEGILLKEDLEKLVEENQDVDELAAALQLYIDSQNDPEVVRKALEGLPIEIVLRDTLPETREEYRPVGGTVLASDLMEGDVIQSPRGWKPITKVTNYPDVGETHIEVGGINRIYAHSAPVTKGHLVEIQIDDFPGQADFSNLHPREAGFQGHTALQDGKLVRVYHGRPAVEGGPSGDFPIHFSFTPRLASEVSKQKTEPGEEASLNVADIQFKQGELADSADIYAAGVEAGKDPSNLIQMSDKEILEADGVAEELKKLGFKGALLYMNEAISPFGLNQGPVIGTSPTQNTVAVLDKSVMSWPAKEKPADPDAPAHEISKKEFAARYTRTEHMDWQSEINTEADARIVKQVGSDDIKEIFKFYQEKYPKLKMRLLHDTTYIGNATAWAPTNNAGFWDGGTMEITVGPGVTPMVLRHEIEHLQDWARGKRRDESINVPAPDGGYRSTFSRYQHDAFGVEYVHRQRVKEAIAEGKIASHPDYPDLKGTKKEKPAGPRKIPQTHDLTETQIRLIEMSQNLTGEQKAFAEDIRRRYDELAHEALEDEVIFNILDNYMSRSWILDKKHKQESTSTFTQNTIHAKERRLGTVIEGWALGLEMQSPSAIDNLVMYRETMIRVMEQKRLLQAMKKAKDNKGRRLLTTDKERPGYMKVRLPGFRTDKALYAPKEVAQNLNDIFGISPLYQSEFITKLTQVNAMMKKIALSTSFFHNLAFIRSFYLGGKTAKWTNMNPFQAHRDGLEMVRNMDDIVVLGVRNGLTLSLIQDWEEELIQTRSALDKMTSKHTKSKRIRNLVGDLWRRQIQFTFGVQGTGLKVKAFALEMQNEMKKNPNEDVDIIAKRVAALMNDDFGGLHLERIGRSPLTQHIFRLVALAPDWTESNIRTVIGMFSHKSTKKQRQLYRKFWARVILKNVAATSLLNFALAGGDVEEAYKRWKQGVETDWKNIASVDITPLYDLFGRDPAHKRYFSVAGHFLDPIKYTGVLAGHGQAIQHKSSMLGRLFSDWIFNRNWQGKRYKNLSEIPLGVHDYLDYLDPNTYVTYRPKVRRGMREENYILDSFSWPSFIMHALISSSPIAFQNLLAVTSGQIDAMDGVLNTLGARVRPRKQKAL